MKFVSAGELKKGMRLARPIYNKNGVLLYDRGTKLTKQGINSINNFRLYGVYILEPVEPIPPMTEEDIALERFQTMNVYGIRDAWELIAMGKNPAVIDTVVKNIQEEYLSNSKKIDFSQTLRSEEDYLYKHALNVGILSALMSTRLKMTVSEQRSLIKAALLYDIGYDNEEIKKTQFADEDDYHNGASAKSNRIIGDCDYINSDIKNIVTARSRLQAGTRALADSSVAVRILQAAQEYDYMTAAKNGAEPVSDVIAIRKLLAHNKRYGVNIVAALVDCLKVLYPGVCVELTDGSTGLVIKANRENVLRPMILLFDGNKVIDLGDNKTFGEVQIADIMKKLDKRVQIDPETIKLYMDKYTA